MPQKQMLWVVVADGEHARILVVGATPGSYRTERSFDSVTAHKKSAELVTDTAGRSHESANPARHAIAPHNDPHVMAKEHFIAEVAEEINQAAIGGAFNRLVLVAPAHALEQLRKTLSAEATAKMVGVLQKDLVKVPDPAIAKHLIWDVMHTGSL